MTVVRGADKQYGQFVTQDGHALVEGISKSDLEFHSIKEEQAYSIVSQHTTVGADEEFLYFKNLSSDSLFIVDSIVVCAGVNTTFTMFKVTSGTAAGTDIEPLNLNLGSGNTADMTVYGNEQVTGSLSGDTILIELVTANNSEILDLQGGLVLGKNDQVAITSSTAGTAYATVIGHFRRKDR